MASPREDVLVDYAEVVHPDTLAPLARVDAATSTGSISGRTRPETAPAAAPADLGLLGLAASLAPESSRRLEKELGELVLIDLKAGPAEGRALDLAQSGEGAAGL